jgi:branched-chain amino acid transport system permease protein
MALAISYYVTRVINFAQGQMLMVSIMVSAALAAIDIPVWLAILAGIAGSCVVGILSYLVSVRPVIKYNRFSFGWLVSTLGFALVVENAAAYFFGPDSRPYPSLLNSQSVDIAGATLTGQQIAAIFVAVIFAALFEVLRRRTLFGKLGMATAIDAEMAAAIGVNTLVVALVTFAISGLFSGAAGVLIAPRTFANPYLGNVYGTYGFVAMMIGGGTEKPVAAMYGGFLLGVLSEGANSLINSQASDWFPFLVLVVILIVTPKGLFASGNLLQRLRAAKPAAA